MVQVRTSCATRPMKRRRFRRQPAAGSSTPEAPATHPGATGAGIVSGPPTRSPTRATVTIGATSLLSTIFLAAHGDPWAFVSMTPATATIGCVLGIFAVAAGISPRALPIALVGIAFYLAPLVILIQLVAGTDWLGGNTSTLSLWTGLGSGLLAVSLIARRTRGKASTDAVEAARLP